MLSRSGLMVTGPGGRTGFCVTSLPCWPVSTLRVSRGPPLCPPGDYITILITHVTCHDSVELAGALTRGMMVVDRRPGAETRDQRRVTLIEELDTDILIQSLTRAFSVQ